ncbi:MAG: DUF1801 domain-containing protein [Gemmatimonadales bacterium]
MADLKTKPTRASVADYIASRASDQQGIDVRQVMKLLAKITGKRPQMWGPSIIGYGKYRYTYDSGRTGEMPLVGLAIRGRDLVLYVLAEDASQKARRAKLGKHSMGKSCLYFRQLADLDVAVLEDLVRASIAGIKRRYGGT